MTPAPTAGQSGDPVTCGSATHYTKPRHVYEIINHYNAELILYKLGIPNIFNFNLKSS